ncbi:MAG: hypothetical protein NVSMB40_10890 [Aquirhabdus sp.]
MAFQKSKQKNKSPIIRKTMRNPGESIQEEIERQFSEEFAPFIMVSLCSIYFATYTWGQWYFKWSPQPVAMTFVALLMFGYTIYKFFNVRKDIKNLRQGLEGEKAIGQFLELIRDQDCRVFHDIITDKANIDHIFISPKGIFVIETKTYSKPTDIKPVIDFNGERILVNGFEPDRNPVAQTNGLVGWLQEMLLESTGRKFPIKGVIVFPGWYIENNSPNKSKLWVLNPKALPAYMENEPNLFKIEDISLISSRITAHMRNVKTN